MNPVRAKDDGAHKLLGTKTNCVGAHVSLLGAKFIFLGTLEPPCGDTGPIKVCCNQGIQHSILCQSDREMIVMSHGWESNRGPLTLQAGVVLLI